MRIHKVKSILNNLKPAGVHKKIVNFELHAVFKKKMNGDQGPLFQLPGTYLYVNYEKRPYSLENEKNSTLCIIGKNKQAILLN